MARSCLKGLTTRFYWVLFLGLGPVSCSQDPSYLTNEAGSFSSEDLEQATEASAHEATNEVADADGTGDATSGDGDSMTETGGDTGLDRGKGQGGSALSLVEKTYNATVAETARMSLTWDGNRVEQRVVTGIEEIPTKRSYTQTDRAVVTQMFTQGSVRQDLGESFTQSGSGGNGQGVLDIVLVVDNSGSMSEEQANLSGKLAPLLQYVQDSDWRIGVVTTDPNNGCLRGLISKGDANAAQAFATAVTPGTNGSGNERGILQAVNALKGECNPSGSWLRPTSTVAVLIVSDEDNCSNGAGCSGQPYRLADYLVNYLATIRTPGTDSRVYGLIRHPSQTNAQCSTAENTGTIYADAITRTSGTWGSICATDFGPTLRAISQNIAVILQSQFALQYPPYNGVAQVYVGGVLQTTGYSISGNVVTFQNPPQVGAMIRVVYHYYSEPPRTNFVLSSAIDPATLEVSVDGAIQNKNLYSYDSPSRTVNFGTPPQGQQVKVVARAAGTLTKTYAIPDLYNHNTLNVNVNGTPASAFTVQGDFSALTFTTAPADGAVIELNYMKLGAPVLSYPVFSLPGVAMAVTDVQGRPLTGMSVLNGRLEIQPENFQNGKTVVIGFENPEASPWQLNLTHAVVAESVAVSSARGVCDPSNVELTDGVMDVSACGFALGEVVNVTFDMVLRQTKMFTVDDPMAAMGDKVTWTVKVNGILTSTFLREGNVISFDELPQGAVVVVALQMAKDS